MLVLRCWLSYALIRHVPRCCSISGWSWGLTQDLNPDGDPLLGPPKSRVSSINTLGGIYPWLSFNGLVEVQRPIEENESHDLVPTDFELIFDECLPWGATIIPPWRGRGEKWPCLGDEGERRGGRGGLPWSSPPTNLERWPMEAIPPELILSACELVRVGYRHRKDFGGPFLLIC